ncbi:unnamed protein product [Ectocarpus sp. 13 AM-2016]
MPQARPGGVQGGGDAFFTRKSGIEAIETMRRKEERKPQAVNSGESCGTWVASDACDEDKSSDDGGGDCDPGSQRLRALLLEAKRAASESAPSSWCGDDDDEEEEEEGGEECGNGVRDSGGEIEHQEEDTPRERVVGRAASAPRLRQSGVTPGTTHGGVGGVCRGRDNGRGAPPAADGDGDDQDGAAALLAALEDVLLCPPQVLARSSSCGGGQGRAPSLSSLLTRASKRRDGRVDGSGGGDDPGAGDGGDEEEKEADAAEAAVKAALAWRVPSRRLSCVLEESGPATGGGGGGRAEPAATATKGNGDRVTPKSIPEALPDKVSSNCGPAFFSPSEDDDGDARGCGDVVVAGFGEKGGKGAVASGSVKGGGGGGPTPPRRGSGSGSGESESTQSVGVGSTAIMTTPSRSPMSKGDEDRDRPALATAAGGGDGGGTAVATREVSEVTKFGDDSDHDNDVDDDDDSGPVVAWPAGSSATEGRRGSGVGGSAGRGSFTSVASSARSGGEISSSNGRVHQGGGATKSPGGDSPSLATRTLNREERIRTVFGQKAVEAAAATVAPASGSDSSSQLLFAAANRISALPAQERSLLAELDRASDVNEGEGDGGGFVDDAGVVVADNGAKTNEGVISSPQGGHEDGAPASPSLAGDGNPARASAEPKLLRVGSAEGDGGETTPFRYRRLMGLSRRGWPSCVNPARREEWLCPVEFEAVFAMSFLEFRALPSWKRVALKRELLLF